MDLGSGHTRTLEQSRVGKARVDEFVQANRDSSFMIFTDGAVENNGLGSCAAVQVPTRTENTEKVATEAFSTLTDNMEAKVCGIA